MRKLLLPEQARAEWARRYAGQHLAWWRASDAEARSGAWPQSLSLGMPSAAMAAEGPALVRAWAQAWQAWAGPGEVRWEERQWPQLGPQRLPTTLIMPSPEAVADLAGEGARWRRAGEHRRRLARALPPGAAVPEGARIFDALADWPDADIELLAAVIAWAAAHRESGLFLRQLPVPGLHSKWIEQRRTVVHAFAGALAAALTGPSTGAPASGGRDAVEDANAEPRDLHRLLGLARAPTRLRLRVLCPHLRRALGGLSDIEAPRNELAELDWQPARVLVVENLESGLALPELPGTVALMKLGHAVSLLAGIDWLQSARVQYWGDIDSHGLAILSQARRALPHLQSVLMDRETLLAHRSLWVTEPAPWSGPAPEYLNASERSLFDALLAGAWAPRVRLEQERIPWAAVPRALEAPEALSGM